MIHCIPLIPFFASVALILFYLKQGGVCYLVEEAVFRFYGCEICPETGYPPINNTCFYANGTNLTLFGSNLINDFAGGIKDTDVDSLTDSYAPQGEYCAYNNPDGPQDVNFCWFGYDEE